MEDEYARLHHPRQQRQPSFPNLSIDENRPFPAGLPTFPPSPHGGTPTDLQQQQGLLSTPSDARHNHFVSQLAFCPNLRQGLHPLIWGRHQRTSSEAADSSVASSLVMQELFAPFPRFSSVTSYTPGDRPSLGFTPVDQVGLFRGSQPPPIMRLNRQQQQQSQQFQARGFSDVSAANELQLLQTSPGSYLRPFGSLFSTEGRHEGVKEEEEEVDADMGGSGGSRDRKGATGCEAKQRSHSDEGGHSSGKNWGQAASSSRIAEVASERLYSSKTRKLTRIKTSEEIELERIEEARRLQERRAQINARRFQQLYMKTKSP